MSDQELAESGEIDECCARIEALMDEADRLPPRCAQRLAIDHETEILRRRIDMLTGNCAPLTVPAGVHVAAA